MAEAKVKVCGLTDRDDARLAVELGAAMLGFNFYPHSPRYIAPAQAHPDHRGIAGGDRSCRGFRERHG